MSASQRVVTEILAERQRQVNIEGWSEQHDDKHHPGEIARAAACYALNGADLAFGLGHMGFDDDFLSNIWPWDRSWWKPKDARRDLVRAAALIVAEIERIDRAAEKAEHHE